MRISSRVATGRFLLVVLAIGAMNCISPTISAADEPASYQVFRTERTLKTPRSRDPVLGGSREKIFVQVWLPAGVKTVRGAVCNPFSKDEAVSKHWQAACRWWKFAYVQVDFDAVKKDDFPLLTDGLIELAKTSGHAELAHVPFCWTGMSRGGGMSMQLSEMLPERTIASVPVCLEVGPSSEATRRIPVLTVFGEKDGSQMERLLANLPDERRQDARWSIAVQWNRKHEFGQANNVSLVFMDDVIARRVPPDANPQQPVALREYPLADGWLTDLATWGKDGRRAVIRPAAGFQGDTSQIGWLPSQRVAAVWQAFVSGTKEMTIATPAGLGDGQKFELLTPDQPFAVQAAIAPSLSPEKVELWDAHQRLAEKTAAPWNFEATLKPGIHSLIVTATLAGSIVRSSRPHTIVVAETTAPAGSTAAITTLPTGPAEKLEDAYERLLAKFPARHAGRGIDRGAPDGAVLDQPMTYGLLLSSEALRYRVRPSEDGQRRVREAARWLIDNSRLAGDQRVGWGLPQAWDQRPANTSYTITTAVALEGLLDALRLSFWSKSERDELRELARQVCVRWRNDLWVAGYSGGYFSYSPHDHASSWFCINAPAMFLGSLARLQHEHAGQLSAADQKLLQETSDSLAQAIVATVTLRDGAPYWDYIAQPNPLNSQRPNDLVHQAYILWGAEAYRETGGRVSLPWSRAKAVESLDRFWKGEKICFFAQDEATVKPGNREAPSNLWGAGMLLACYARWSTPAQVARCRAAIERDYGPSPQLRVLPRAASNDEQFYPRDAAHVLFGIAHAAFGDAHVGTKN